MDANTQIVRVSRNKRQRQSTLCKMNEMPKKNEQYAYFALYITDEIDPNAITAKIGLKPTEVWKKGDFDALRKVAKKETFWQLTSKLPHTDLLEDHIEDVLNQLDIQSENVKYFTNQFGGILQLVGYFYERYPGLTLGSEAIKRIAHYNLEMDFDFYYLEEDVDENNAT